MKIYGVNLSPYTRKVLLALNHKQLDYELVKTMPGTRTPEYLKISPLGKVPALVDGDLSLADSSVICEYLEDEYPDRQLMPASVERKARARWIERYADSVVAEATTGVFWEVAAKPVITKEPTDFERVALLKNAKFPKVADYLEQQVPVEGFFFGQFGLADIALATHFLAATYVDHNVDANRWPHLAAYIRLLFDHPVVNKQIKVDKAIIAKMM